MFRDVCRHINNFCRYICSITSDTFLPLAALERSLITPYLEGSLIVPYLFWHVYHVWLGLHPSREMVSCRWWWYHLVTRGKKLSINIWTFVEPIFLYWLKWGHIIKRTASKDSFDSDLWQWQHLSYEVTSWVFLGEYSWTTNNGRKHIQIQGSVWPTSDYIFYEMWSDFTCLSRWMLMDNRYLQKTHWKLQANRWSCHRTRSFHQYQCNGQVYT